MKKFTVIIEHRYSVEANNFQDARDRAITLQENVSLISRSESVGWDVISVVDDTTGEEEPDDE